MTISSTPHGYGLDGKEHVSGLPVVDCHHGGVGDHGDHGGGGDLGHPPGPRHADGGIRQQARPHTDPALGNVTFLKISIYEVSILNYNLLCLPCENI